jgi:hypothetical protein
VTEERARRAIIRNLATGAFRRAGYANIAHARRYYGRDDQRIPALYTPGRALDCDL